eukprot:TRINITY_DN26113_c0_g1_i1.p1 TRINITY_DN26113_c0_g1~~TRINITY_DN26113_c0_g1_i1.p1  ORF type:complete len:387 (-),score=72.68 TRINITY_DN26113_c0_g1_i1:127-1287(-)
MKATLLASLLFSSALAWSRFNVGNNSHGQQLTCGGAVFTEQVKKTVRGENPDVPVSIVARYPLLNPLVKFMSDFHVYCAITLLVVAILQFVRPKGNDAGYEMEHVWRGRIVAWGIAPHYVFIGLILNWYAVHLNLEDWQLAPPASDWRLQISYIIPFAINVFVAFAQGFFLCRYSFMPQWTATPLKWLSAFSILFWFTVGVYQTGSQALRLGLGGFGKPPEDVVPGGSDDKAVYEAVQRFFSDENLIVLIVGTCQACQDLIFFKCLQLVEKSGNKELAWKDMHKWAMVDLMYQAGVIFGLFLGFFPYCLFGFPDWTCIRSPWFAAPFIAVFISPVLPHVTWIYSFVSALFGPVEKIIEFSKDNHAWDVPYDGPKGKTGLYETLSKA